MNIDKNVPTPPIVQQGRMKYPWGKMGVGDSFFVPCERNTRQEQNLRTLACNTGKRRHTFYMCRRVEGGLRIWRTA